MAKEIIVISSPLRPWGSSGSFLCWLSWWMRWCRGGPTRTCLAWCYRVVAVKASAAILILPLGLAGPFNQSPVDRQLLFLLWSSDWSPTQQRELRWRCVAAHLESASPHILTRNCLNFVPLTLSSSFKKAPLHISTIPLQGQSPQICTVLNLTQHEFSFFFALSYESNLQLGCLKTV